MKKYLLILLAPLFLFLTSCVNSVEEPTYNPGSVTIEQNTFRQISKTVQGDESLSSIPIELIFSLNSKNIDSISTTIGEIGKETLELKNIPFGKGLILSLDILYKKNSIYKGESKAFELSQEKMNPKVELDLSPVSYTITYKLSEGIDKLDSPIIKTSSYTFDSLITLPKAISNGKNFKGWSVDGNSVTTLGRENTFGNVTLYPIWDIIEYSVTFMNNSEIVRAMKVKPGYTITDKDLVPLTKNGYNFKGWHLFQDKVYPDTFIVRDNIILNALWLEKGYVEDVTFTPSQTEINTPVALDFGEKIYLSCDRSDADIYYTTDGSDPTINAEHLYKGPINLDRSSLVVKAISVKEGLKQNPIRTSRYNVRTYTVTFTDENGTILPDRTISNLVKGATLTREHLKELKPADETKRFVSWMTQDNNSAFIGQTIKGDLTLKASFEPVNTDTVSNVTFKANAKMLDNGETIELSTPTEGATIYYTLDGSSPLDINADRKEYKISTPIILNKDKLTINAAAIKEGLKPSTVTSNTYEMKKYKVIFDSKGKGIEPKPLLNLKRGDVIPEAFLVPLKENGYTFTKWEDDTNTEVLKDYHVTKNTVVSAVWNPITYTIYYHNNESASSEPNKTIESDILLTDPSPIDGYKFMGWYTTSDFQTGTKITRIANRYEDINVYAKWESVLYNITYLNGQVPSGAIKSYTISDKAISLPSPIERKGFTFDGWFLDKETTTSPITEIKPNQTGDLTLYGKWTDNSTVSSVTFTSDDKDYNKGAKITLATTTPSSTIYYTLDKSDPTSTTNIERKVYDSSTPIVLNNDVLTIKAYAESESANLKPSAVSSTTIIMKKYTVFFNTRFGNVSNQKIAKGDNIVKPANLSETGYTFGGWIKTLGDTPDNDVLWNFDTDTVDTSNIVLKAKWTPNIYKINFNANNVSTLTDSSQEFDYDSSFVTPSNNLNRTGYSFSYNSVNDGTGDKYSEGTIYKIRELVKQGKFNEQSELTLYAQYKPITYQVYLDNDPIEVESNPTYETYSYDQSITLPFDIKKSGYSFDFLWKNLENGKTYRAGDTVKNLSSKQDEQITLTAQFTNTAPSPVTNVKTESTDKSVTLTWTDPIETDVSKISITYTPDAPSSPASPIEVARGTQTATISNLKNDTLYTFTLTAVDNNSVPLNSTDVTVKSYANPLQTLTESMVELPSTTDGSIGTSGKYVLYGDWPQTLKASDVDIVSTEPISLNNGLQCYLGNDNCYYVKVANAKSFGNSTKFNYNTTSIVPNASYYFKVEPIKWRVLSDTYDINNKLLLAETILDGKIFDSTSLDFKDSSIKTFLNTDFYEKAFTATAKNKIIPNPLIDGTDNNVFLLSSEDIQNTTYSFRNHVLSDTARGRRASDFARVKGLKVYEGTPGYPDKNNSVWWTSTKDYRPEYPGTIITIGGDGSLGGCVDSKPSYEAYGGVVPAIVYGTKANTTIQSFSLPQVGTLKKGQPLSFRVSGTDLIKGHISGGNIIFTGSTELTSGANATVLSNDVVEVTTSIPQNAGTYNISIDIGNGQKQSSNLIVRDTAKLQNSSNTTIKTGDIVTYDGIIQESSTVTSSSKAVGVVFITEYGAAYIVGPDYSTSQLNWAAPNTTGLNTMFTDIISTPSVTDKQKVPEAKYSGDLNGSDNWAYIQSIDKEGTKNAAVNYPAFDYANNYGNNFPSPFSNGWFIPSVYELSELCKVKNDVNSTLGTLGKSILDKAYWSSSQVGSDADNTWNVHFELNWVDVANPNQPGKTTAKFTLCIRDLGPFEPELKSLYIPKVGLSQEVKTVDVNLYGYNFDPILDKNNITIESPGNNITEIDSSIKPRTISNHKITFHLNIPSTAGDYPITVKYGDQILNSTLSVVDYQTKYPELKVGDVFLDDGTAVASTTLKTPEQKAKAVAVFYGAYNNYGAPLGLGLKRSEGYLKWSPINDPNFTVPDIESKLTPGSANYYYYITPNEFNSVVFEPGSDTDGGDNWDVIKYRYPQYAKDVKINFPVFDYVLNYGKTNVNNTSYQAGWYIPTIKELLDLYKLYNATNNTAIIDEALSNLGDPTTKGIHYVGSSSLDSIRKNYCWHILFGRQNITGTEKDMFYNEIINNDNSVIRPIRQF